MAEQTLAPRSGGHRMGSVVRSVALAWLCAAGLHEVVLRTAGSGPSRSTGADGRRTSERIQKHIALSGAPQPAIHAGYLDILRLLPPSTCGIATWSPGESAEYVVTRGGRQPDAMEAIVLRQAHAEDAYFRESEATFQNQTWLLFIGAKKFRAHPMDVFRLVTPGTMLPSPDTPEFGWFLDF